MNKTFTDYLLITVTIIISPAFLYVVYKLGEHIYYHGLS